MGELIFSFAYGSALIIMGLVTRFFLKRMEAGSPATKSTKSIESNKSNVKFEKVV